MDINLESYLIKEAPNSVYYIANFITIEEENFLLKNVYNAPKPKWTCLQNRKLQDYGGVPHKNGLIAEDIPSWLQTYMDKISSLNVFSNSKSLKPFANHCLINEYVPGQGIMPHFDGPIFTPTITTISCGSHTMLEFWSEIDGQRCNICKLLLEPRSLVVLQNEMYTKYLHSISELTKDMIDENCINLNYCSGNYKIGDILERETRVSFTIRNVPKVLKCNLFNKKNLK